MSIPLEYPLFLLLIPLGLVAVFKLVHQKSGIGFSSAALLRGIGTGVSVLVLERLFLAVFVVTAALILARPTRLLKTSVPVYSQARDITLVLDISGSMSGNNIEAAKSVISEFVVGRPQDRIALFVFNSSAFLEWPLSPDHETLIYRLKNVMVDGSTSIGAGLIAGLAHQQQSGQNSGAVILVSDGGSIVTSEEKETIENTLGETKIYWIWISEEGEEEDQTAQQFNVYVTYLGGKVYHGGTEDLDEIFGEINQLEASPVLYQQHVSTTYNFGVLPWLALTGLLLAGLVHIGREV